jgi:hypothetical protein
MTGLPLVGVPAISLLVSAAVSWVIAVFLFESEFTILLATTALAVIGMRILAYAWIVVRTVRTLRSEMHAKS